MVSDILGPTVRSILHAILNEKKVKVILGSHPCHDHFYNVLLYYLFAKLCLAIDVLRCLNSYFFLDIGKKTFH